MIRLLTCIAVIAYVATLPERNILEDVKSGKLTLTCNDKVVHPDRVVDFVEGVWIFDNGYAKNCEVME